MLQVVVGIILRNNQILIAQRPQHACEGGLWEFPGGKVEANESLYAALCRELKEELGIEVHCAENFFQHVHHYPHKSIHLFSWYIKEFSQEPCSCEGQLLQWVPMAELKNYSLLAGNQLIIDSLLIKYHDISRL